MAVAGDRPGLLSSHLVEDGVKGVHLGDLHAGAVGELGVLIKVAPAVREREASEAPMG